ncbi:MAG: DUF1294 domain-containing protein [Paludibacteraceae bacterium]|nr:DUF1294 domain-containing protein [Paludibacteraceae bacterium]
MNLYYYLIVVNLMAFALYGIDKLKARHHWWRIPEWVLLTVAAIGGSIGAWVGMKCFHHKTLKPLFRFGVPVVLLLQIAVLAYKFFLSQ